MRARSGTPYRQRCRGQVDHIVRRIDMSRERPGRNQSIDIADFLDGDSLDEAVAVALELERGRQPLR